MSIYSNKNIYFILIYVTIIKCYGHINIITIKNIIIIYAHKIINK